MVERTYEVPVAMYEKINSIQAQKPASPKSADKSARCNKICTDTLKKNKLIENTNKDLELQLKKSNVAKTNLRGIIAELCDKRPNKTDKLCIGEPTVNPTQNGPLYKLNPNRTNTTEQVYTAPKQSVIPVNFKLSKGPKGTVRTDSNPNEITTKNPGEVNKGPFGGKVTAVGKKRRTMKKNKNKKSVKKNKNKRKATMKKDLRKKRKSNKKK